MTKEHLGLNSKAGQRKQDRELSGASGINWENIYLFLQVARDGSFRAAASRLGISFNKLRRRVQDLEKQVGILLMTRHVEGIQLTEEGRRLCKTAEQMERVSFEGMRQLRHQDATRTGIVRIATTERLGMSWIMPESIAFQRASPGLIIDLLCNLSEINLLRMEADIAIGLQRPEEPDLICVRLGWLHLMPFAAKSYIEQNGQPISIEEILKHKIVEQRDMPEEEEPLQGLLPDTKPEGLVAIRTNTSSAHYLAVAEGAGIGMLPSYATLLDPNLVPLDLQVQQKYEVWMSYHQDAASIPRVRLTMNWLKRLFTGRTYPWFRNEFVHPSQFPVKERQSTDTKPHKY